MSAIRTCRAPTRRSASRRPAACRAARTAHPTRRSAWRRRRRRSMHRGCATGGRRSRAERRRKRLGAQQHAGRRRNVAVPRVERGHAAVALQRIGRRHAAGGSRVRQETRRRAPKPAACGGVAAQGRSVMVEWVSVKSDRARRTACGAGRPRRKFRTSAAVRRVARDTTGRCATASRARFRRLRVAQQSGPAGCCSRNRGARRDRTVRVVQRRTRTAPRAFDACPAGWHECC